MQIKENIVQPTDVYRYIEKKSEYTEYCVLLKPCV